MSSNLDNKTVEAIEKTNGFFQNMMSKITDNKMYMYIAIGVVILAGLGYYYYRKNKRDTVEKLEDNKENSNLNEELRKQLDKQKILEMQLQQMILEKQQNERNNKHKKLRTMRLKHPEDSDEKEEERPQGGNFGVTDNVSEQVRNMEDDNVSKINLSREDLEAIENELDN
jgi:LPXTG-motif cell wall-anchored protein